LKDLYNLFVDEDNAMEDWLEETDDRADELEVKGQAAAAEALDTVMDSGEWAEDIGDQYYQRRHAIVVELLDAAVFAGITGVGAIIGGAAIGYAGWGDKRAESPFGRRLPGWIASSLGDFTG